MARKQVGQIDADLLARVDERAAGLGQTRRVFVERALVAALAPGVESHADLRDRLASGVVNDPMLPRWTADGADIRAQEKMHRGLGKGYTPGIPKGKK
jgi:Arc/MetJ family transcription regulator